MRGVLSWNSKIAHLSSKRSINKILFNCIFSFCYFLQNYLYYNTSYLLKNPSFSVEIFYKNKKALQQRPKGWKCLGTPVRQVWNFLLG